MTDMSYDSHYHWTFYGQNTGAEGWMSVEVIGYSTEERALDAVRHIVARDTWLLHEVRECTSCGAAQRQVHAVEQMAERING